MGSCPSLKGHDEVELEAIGPGGTGVTHLERKRARSRIGVMMEEGR